MWLWPGYSPLWVPRCNTVTFLGSPWADGEAPPHWLGAGAAPGHWWPLARSDMRADPGSCQNSSPRAAAASPGPGTTPVSLEGCPLVREPSKAFSTSAALLSIKCKMYLQQLRQDTLEGWLRHWGKDWKATTKDKGKKNVYKRTAQNKNRISLFPAEQQSLGTWKWLKCKSTGFWLVSAWQTSRVSKLQF